MIEKKNRGGARPLSGRKKTNAETKIISFRVPMEKARILKQKIKTIIKND